ncbi:organic anion transporter 3 isoform X2 [Drosophila sulfurigaster albostrigata]|nr:organic anion transporter 3 isoform X2 [Drosophila sulfurigaster albostrigata]
MLSNLCALIGGLLSAFCNNFIWFSITRFVVGLALNNCCIPVYVLMMECLPSKYRPAVTNFSLTICFLPAACLLPWIALWCNNWRLLAIVTSAPLVICLLMYFCLQESPRWLISIGKMAKAMKIIEYIAKVNGKEISKELMTTFEKCCILAYNEEKQWKQYTLLDLFRSYRMCFITLDLVIIWMITALVYDAHVRAIIEIGPDVFITFSVAGAMELPACLVPFFFLDFVGRKCMCLFAFIGCAVGSLIAALLRIKWQIAVTAIFGRFCATITFNIGVQWAAEILPTVVRGQGIAFIQIMGFVSSLLSPFVVYTKIYSPSAPMAIIAALSICAAVFVLFLPDTTRSVLPQLPEDTEKLSKNQKIYVLKRK